jgi:predicted transposase/invertase (TIGR01784 family)
MVMNLNRKNDLLFKRIFGQDKNRDILASFLSEVLGTAIKPQELTIVKSDIPPDYDKDKNIILDVRVKRTKTHENMNIEIQRQSQRDIDKRILYYWCKGFTEDFKEGQNYRELPKQITILIADFDLFQWKDEKKYHSEFHLRENKEEVRFSEAMEIHVLEIPKFRRQKFQPDSILHCWMLYLDNMQGEIMEQIAQRVPMIKKAMTVEEIFMKSEHDKYLYEIREKAKHDGNNLIYTARMEGLEEGIEKGMEKGKLETAHNLLKAGVAIEIIAEATGFSLKEIRKLKNKE